MHGTDLGFFRMAIEEIFLASSECGDYERSSVCHATPVPSYDPIVNLNDQTMLSESPEIISVVGMQEVPGIESQVSILTVYYFFMVLSGN